MATYQGADSHREDEPPIVRLSEAPGGRESWDRPRHVVYMWAIAELLLVSNPWQISSSIRISTLRLFGADIGRGVIFRPRTRVRFPWKLHIGNDCWIGEGVWFHNQDHIWINNDVTISQETFLTTGSHAHRRDMALITRPISIESGAWITARCIILGGTKIGTSALIGPGTVASGDIPSNAIFSSSHGKITGMRFK
jgi:putative colanic acid biosynthesis acetyltransferase WcaF